VAAAGEAERAITQLGFKGILVNGYSNAGDENHAEYLDLPKFFPFWERVESLGVPVYLHPRAPLPSQRVIYEGHDEMMGPMWAFGAETAAHALRLMTSGLFDRYPRQQVILGHMGEGLVAMMARAQRRFEYGILRQAAEEAARAVLTRPLLYHDQRQFPHADADQRH